MRKRGGTQSSAHCSPQPDRCPAQAGGDNVQPARMTERGMWLTVSRLQARATTFGSLSRRCGRRAAFGAARSATAKPASEQRSSRGVSDPPRLPPIPVPRSERGGSLTPRLRVPAVRTHRSLRASSIRHRGGPRVGRPLVVHRASRRSCAASIFIKEGAPMRSIKPRTCASSSDASGQGSIASTTRR